MACDSGSEVPPSESPFIYFATHSFRRVAHLITFGDACPTDWLRDGGDEEWHTIVHYMHPLHPKLWPRIAGGEHHEQVLADDPLFSDAISELKRLLPGGKLKPWKSRSEKYRRAFCDAFESGNPKLLELSLSACSFKEITLRAYRSHLLDWYNRLVGGVEGRGVGFETVQGKRSPELKHSYVCGRGYFEIKASENKMLVLLLTACLLADQYRYWRSKALAITGIDEIYSTVVSDTLSGDCDKNRPSELLLRRLIDPEYLDAPIKIVRNSDDFSGDLLADNTAGWLTSALRDPAGIYASKARSLAVTGLWKAWRQIPTAAPWFPLVPAVSQIETST